MMFKYCEHSINRSQEIHTQMYVVAWLSIAKHSHQIYHVNTLRAGIRYICT